MPEETFETLQPTEPKPTNWPKIILAAVLGLGLLAVSAYAGYYYGTQQVQQPEKAAPVVSQPTTTPTTTPTPTPEPTPPPTVSIPPLEGWESFESNPTGILLKYPLTMIACGNRRGETTPRTYISVRTTEPCDSLGASENRFWVADESLSIKSGENQLYNYLKDLGVGQTKQGMTEGERMAGVTYTRIEDTKIGGLPAQNYRSDSNPNKRDNKSSFYSFVFGSNDTAYFISQNFLNSYPNQYQTDFSKTFKNILSTLNFAL